MIDNDMGLGAYDQEYESTVVIDRSFKLPDGRYPAHIDSCVLDRDQNNNPRFTLNLRILGGEYESIVVPLDSGFHDSNKILFLKKNLLALGAGHVKPSDLQRDEVRRQFVGLRVELESYTTTSKKDGKTWTGNLKINRVINGHIGSIRPEAPTPSKVAGAIQPTASKPAPFDDSELPF